VDAEPHSTRWRARWYRRRKAALAAASLPVVAALVAAYFVEPTHRATATLRIEGRSATSALDEAATSAEAIAHVDELQRQAAAQVASRGDRAVVRIDDVEVYPESDGRSSVSISFDVIAEHSDPRRAGRVAIEVVDRYVALDRQAASMPSAAPPALEEARLTADGLAAEVQAIESERDEFRRANGGVLGIANEQSNAAVERAERLQIERQIAELEARRVELDQGLREMEVSDARFDDVVSNEALTAIQTKWAVLRGREGRDSAAAAELAQQIRRIRGEADRRLTAATKELEEAGAELARLERLHTIEHPDVVAQAHKLSALESRFDGLRVRGMADADIAYIEDLARERREIDGRIAEARARHSAIAVIATEQQQRAALGPVLREQYLALEQQLATARSSYEAARDRQASLETELAALRERRPGRLAVLAPPQVERVLFTRSAVILTLGGALAVVAAFLAVALRERFDKRVTGAVSIRRLLGSDAIVVEIPIIGVVAGSGHESAAERAAA
jgi:hypothetical protein